MLAYVLRRLMLVVPTLFGIMVLNFFIVQAAPGGPVEQMIARIEGTAVGATERFSDGVCRLMEPKIGPNPAAAMPMPHATFPRVSMTPSVANAIMNMPPT